MPSCVAFGVPVRMRWLLWWFDIPSFSIIITTTLAVAAAAATLRSSSPPILVHLSLASVRTVGAPEIRTLYQTVLRGVVFTPVDGRSEIIGRNLVQHEALSVLRR